MYPEDYLMHYGVKGMKWGIRKERKLVERKDKAKEEKSGFRLSDKQKRYIKIGLGVAGAIAVAYGLYKLSDISGGNSAKSEKLSESLKKELTEREFDSRVGFFKKSKTASNDISFDLSEINKGNRFKKGGTSNCTFCTTAYELRRRGYDVHANLTSTGRSRTHASKFFKNAVVESDSRLFETSKGSTLREYINELSAHIAKQGDGARGNFCGKYQFGGGHSIAYEVMNGKTVFLDGQTGKRYASAEEALQWFTPGQSNWWRTDNLEIDTERIKEAVSTIGVHSKYRNVMEYDSEIANAIRKEALSFSRLYGVPLAEAKEYVYRQYR